MSKIKRMKLQMETPAFNLKPIDDNNANLGIDTPARSAAEAQAISNILPHICLGSWRDAESAETVKEFGITHVLNVAKECPSRKEQELMDALEVEKKQIPLVDAHSENILPHFEEAFQFIDDARAKGGRVLVHCRRGISRSPAIVTGYIMTKTGLTYETALAFVIGCRSSVSLNLAFRELLGEYHPVCPNVDTQIAAVVQGSPSGLGQGDQAKRADDAIAAALQAKQKAASGSSVEGSRTTSTFTDCGLTDKTGATFPSTSRTTSGFGLTVDDATAGNGKGFDDEEEGGEADGTPSSGGKASASF